jgi:hypothetical protein
MTTCEFCGEGVPPGIKLCPNCGMVVSQAAPAGGGTESPVFGDDAFDLDLPLVMPDGLDLSATPEPLRPPAGTPCLVIYGADRTPRAYFPLTKDAVLVGRLDPVQGSFPDIDMNEWLSPAEVRKISREHALVLFSRAKKEFSIRPLKGNTGTQLEKMMLEADKLYPLQPGQRLILGGVARLKFEIT